MATCRRQLEEVCVTGWTSIREWRSARTRPASSAIWCEVTYRFCWWSTSASRNPERVPSRCARDCPREGSVAPYWRRRHGRARVHWKGPGGGPRGETGSAVDTLQGGQARPYGKLYW